VAFARPVAEGDDFAWGETIPAGAEEVSAPHPPKER
jgi:hypothetical protein